MHITESQQPSNTILTKCTKMTEEEHRRHGMNGSADSGAVAIKEECPRGAVSLKEDYPRNVYGQGGRLKFFKDGKFILELERAREGERVSWVSVPRKTFWPPQGTAASTPTYRQESSTSLSVSDDNSSIQSSPWQRDHSWKQTTPRRNLSKEMTFYYWLPKFKRQNLKNKRYRRPHLLMSPNHDDSNLKKVSNSERTNMCNNKVNVKPKVRPSLLIIVQNLLDKSASSTPPRTEMVVSPRKRFLREMEKDKIQLEDACQKRSRNKSQPMCAPVTSSSKVNSPVRVNGAVAEEARQPRNCSYSITSLLAEDRNSRRSPENSPSHFTSITQAQYCSPSPEDRWYSESVDRLRSIELSQADKRALSYSPYPFIPPYVYSYSLPPYYSPAGMYGRSYVVPPVYPAQPLPMMVKQETPSCSWVAEPSRDNEHRDDNITDMPLNLSKHAG